MNAIDMLNAAEKITANAAKFLAFGVVYSQADKLATDDAAAILAAASFGVSIPTKTTVDAMHTYDASMEAAAGDYGAVVAISKQFAPAAILTETPVYANL